MTAIGSPCEAAKRTTWETPWEINVSVNVAVKRKFKRACKAAYRAGKRRRFIGRVSRRAVRKFGKKAPKFFHRNKDKRNWVPQRIDSYNCRQIRGSSSWSRHAYAAAWDFFATGPTEPPPGGVWKPDNTVPPWFAHHFKKRGFTWGAEWSRADWPHLEWSGSEA